MAFTFTRFSYNSSNFIDNDRTAHLQRLGKGFLQNIQTLHLWNTFIDYLNAGFAANTDLTSYVFLNNIWKPYAP